MPAVDAVVRALVTNLGLERMTVLKRLADRGPHPSHVVGVRRVDAEPIAFARREPGVRGPNLAAVISLPRRRRAPHAHRHRVEEQTDAFLRALFGRFAVALSNELRLLLDLFFLQ